MWGAGGVSLGLALLLSVAAVSSAGMVDYLTGYQDLSSKVDSVHESTQKHIDALYKRIEALEAQMKEPTTNQDRQKRQSPCHCPAGPKGDQGHPGQTGEKGQKGTGGANGWNGKPGKMGRNGTKGEKGEKGVEGVNIAIIQEAMRNVTGMNDQQSESTCPTVEPHY